MIFPNIYTDPFGALTRNWGTLFQGTPSGLYSSGNGWTVLVDIADHSDAYTITADLPGVNPDDVTISVDGDILKVTGERATPKATADEGPRYYHMERGHGAFERRFQLPANVDADAIEAHFNKGVLSIRIAKQPEAAPRSITVQVN